MRAKRISLTPKLQQEIAFAINTEIINFRIDLLRENARGKTLSNISLDNDLSSLDGDIMAVIILTLGIEPL